MTAHLRFSVCGRMQAARRYSVSAAIACSTPPRTHPSPTGTVSYIAPCFRFFHACGCWASGAPRYAYTTFAEVSESPQGQDPLCSICQNQVTPSFLFSIRPMGRYCCVDQVPRLLKEAAERVKLPLSRNPACDGLRACHCPSACQEL